MSEHQENDGEKKQFQVDSYGLKGSFSLGDAPESPKTWHGVWTSVNTSLMAISANLVGVIEDAVIGTRKIVRGLADLPGAVADRVRGAHRKVEKQEAQRLPAPIPPHRAESDVRDILARLEDKGVVVQIKQQEDGSIFMSLGAPVSDDTAKRITQAAGGAVANLPPPDSGNEPTTTTTPPPGE